jgi:GTP-binding protein Era
MSDAHEQTAAGETFRAGYVAIIGDPNVGKSTLLNSLIGQKLSIVSRKAQTTRHKILGIRSTDGSQCIFLDTPGLLKPTYLLQQAMMNFAYAAIDEADVIVFMIDVTDPKIGPEIEHEVAFGVLAKVRKPVFLVINKTDLVPKDVVAGVIGFYSVKYAFTEIFPISAIRSEGTEDLAGSLAGHLPVHPPYYPPDVVSEHPERFFVGEFIREKIFEQFREEIPYSTTVDILEFKEQAGRKDVIRAEIYVERDSQKGILIGKKGSALREVGEAARKDIEAFLDRKVFLELHVKVRERWRADDAWLKRLGYH